MHKEAVCRTCGQPAGRPYRNRVRGIVEEGCVDTFHDGAMRGDAWHNKPSAKALRREIAAKNRRDRPVKGLDREYA